MEDKLSAAALTLFSRAFKGASAGLLSGSLPPLRLPGPA